MRRRSSGWVPSAVWRVGWVVGSFGLALAVARLWAETGYEAWLRYPPLPAAASRPEDSPLGVVAALDWSASVEAAQGELVRGLQGMLKRPVRASDRLPDTDAILLGTLPTLQVALAGLHPPLDLRPDGYWLTTVRHAEHRFVLIAAENERGVLYGAFALLRRLALRQPIAGLDAHESPRVPLRALNQWDNLDGTIERGYAGRSLFWDAGHLAEDQARWPDFARLLASVGLNACCVNNVNADARLLTPAHLADLARIAESFRPWGVRLLLALDFASPQRLAGLATCDPLDPRVVAFWQRTVDTVYAAVPDLQGFVLKADSEGRLGPSAYGRTHADAANVIARPAARHGGVLFYRAFVYDHHLDWRNRKNDRAKAAYDNFQPLDGRFAENVVVQIKNGPIDFQVREPASPLFSGLARTSEGLELQITQEYLGQQRHLCFLAPLWKGVLDFDLQARGQGTPVKALVAGSVFHQPLGAFAGVSNLGQATNWLAHPLALANLYAFGRLAWDPDLTARRVAREWTRLTFGSDPRVVGTIVGLLLRSWPVYEDYTGPLGAGTLTDILGSHYGPGIESSERNGWGQWHRADAQGVGMDRTVATGTGFVGQYSPPVARCFESLATCPDDLLLFLHHVAYTHSLHSGKTVIQHIYDSHYQGAAEARQFVREWKTLRGRIDDARYAEVLARLQYQAGHAEVWRDAVCRWFLKESGIPDVHGRVGHYPNRLEAEALTLDGYAVIGIEPWEAASGGHAVECVSPDRHGTVSFVYHGRAGCFDLGVQYFDQNNGVSRFRLLVAGRLVDQWAADAQLPGRRPNADTSTRRQTPPVTLVPGDEVRLEAIADGGENAVIDYVEIEPHGR